MERVASPFQPQVRNASIMRTKGVVKRGRLNFETTIGVNTYTAIRMSLPFFLPFASPWLALSMAMSPLIVEKFLFLAQSLI
jgi:hypothetical protein